MYVEIGVEPLIGELLLSGQRFFENENCDVLLEVSRLLEQLRNLS